MWIQPANVRCQNKHIKQKTNLCYYFMKSYYFCIFASDNQNLIVL